MLVIFSKGMTMKDQNCREKKKLKFIPIQLQKASKTNYIES